MSKILERQLRTRASRRVLLATNDNSLIKERLPKYTVSIDSIKDLGMHEGKYVKEVIFKYYLPTKYDDLVNAMVREKYTESEEFAILRKAINGITDEYLIYNAYVEECKVRAKEFVAEREKALGGNN